MVAASSRLAMLTVSPSAVMRSPCSGSPIWATTAWPGMDADADTQRDRQGRTELVVEGRHRLHHGAGGQHRLLRPRRRGRIEAEDRHHAVRDEGVDTPAMRLDGLRHLPDEPVEEQHEVIGQLPARQGVERADVDEEHGDLALDAPAIDLVLGDQAAARRQDRQEDLDGDVALRPSWQPSRTLGGAEMRSSIARSVLARRRQLAQIRDHGDAAGRAAAPAAAERRVGDAMDAACLENGRAAPHLHGAVAGIFDGQEAGAAAVDDPPGDDAENQRERHPP